MKRTVAIALGTLAIVGTASSSALAQTQLSGDAVYDAEACPAPPPGYEEFTDYDGLLLTGDLEGCWYTNVQWTKETPSGVWIETGHEVFIGSLNGGPEGTFTTTYRFEGKYDPEGTEIFGRCQHPIVEGSGTGGFEGAKGRLDYKDLVANNPVTYVYRGHIKV